jgi:N-acetylneuraminic acid mutarotase
MTIKSLARIPAVFALICTLGAHGALAKDDSSTAPQKKLDPMLRIAWSRGPNLPQGFQDSHGGVVDDVLITATGFCSGQQLAAKPGRYPRGFLKRVWGLDLSDSKRGWATLPDFPGDARQGGFAIVVDNTLYYWGGFSYSEPYCYRDGYRLSRRNAKWTWEPLPPLPWPLTCSGICAIGPRIYVTGGADYDAQRFYTDADRTGGTRRLGSRLLTIDTKNLTAGWKTLAECPGTPRWVHATAAVGGKVYVIGGATGERPIPGGATTYCTIVDNWKYDPAPDRWTRIRDLPISSGNFPGDNVAFKDRYLILIGGYQYPMVANPDGTLRDKYGAASKFQGKGAYHNDVFVYDTRTNLFGSADKLPLNNNVPMAVVREDEVFLIGGETGGATIDGEAYGHHPDLFLRGRIEEIRIRH